MTEKFEMVIGLEVHVQVKSASKMFCGCSTEFGAEPNTQTCPVCTGLPGVLPVINKKVVEDAVKTGHVLNCAIAGHSIFARKNYFYPDLPKNYQISQYEKPLAENGWVEVNVHGEKKKIGITRVHLEEDAGKLIHDIGAGSLVDLNRTGTPLMEIVSTPCMSDSTEAYEYLKALKTILQYMNVSDCDMEKGSLRCDANVSVRKKGQEELGTKTEIKNLNSFKAVQKALDYEAERQAGVLLGGGRVVQETRLWDEASGTTVTMRSKEEAHDYRYFPEPDLVPIKISIEWRNELLKGLPELPAIRAGRFMKDYGLSEYDTGVLTADKSVADFYEECVKKCKTTAGQKLYKTAANWVMGDLLGHLNADNKDIKASPVSTGMLAGMIELIENGTISGKIAKTVFDEMYSTSKKPEAIIKEKNLVQVSDEGELEAVIKEAIEENQEVVRKFKEGKAQALGFLVGQVMKKSQGKANPAVVNKMLVEKLKG